MKKIISIIIAVQLCLAATGQEYFSQTVVGSGGGQTNNATWQTSWTIGETITETGTSGGTTLSQGFQQGPLLFNLLWTGAVNSNWNTAANWNPAGVPTYESNATIPVVLTQYPIVNEALTAPAECNHLTIDVGTPVVTIAPAKALTVYGNLTNNSGVEGLMLQSNADGTGSLLHKTAGVDATIKRFVTGSSTLTDKMYHQVSVPLVPANNSFSSLFLGAYLYDFDVAANAWNSLGTPTNIPLDETRGYMIYATEATHTYTFEGQINAGEFSPLVVYEGAGNNLVPNPYPSAINWDAAGWTKTNIADATYIWNVNATVPYEPGKIGNYAAYVNFVGTNGGSPYIPAGQSFFVKATSGSPVLTMNDNVRVHNSQSFFKIGEEIPYLLRILAEANDYKDEAVVRFCENATTSADTDFDAWKLYGTDGAPQLYTIATDNTMLAINSLPYLETAYTVPLNFEMTISKPVTLTFSNFESFETSTNIYLKDEFANQTINLRNQPVYEFNHNTANAAGRFKLIFGGSTGIDESVYLSENLMWITDGKLIISAPKLTGKSAVIEIFNLTGQKLMNKTIVLSELSTIELNHTGFVVARLTSGQYVTSTKGFLKNK